MRSPTEHVAKDGTRTWKVKYRAGGIYTSQTFRHKRDAHTFAAVLDGGGATDALAWLNARDTRQSDVTFADWHRHYVDQLTGVTARTREDYHALRRRYLAALDPLPLPVITRTHITTLVNRLERDGRSPKTIRNVVHMVSSCLALAVEEGHIVRNPCRKIPLPKRSLDQREAAFLSPDEFRALLEATPDHYKPLVYTLGATGLRWSEATALMGEHLAGDRLTIRQAWKRIPGGWEMGVTKTRGSRRTIALHADLADLLDGLAHRGRLMFTTPQGHAVRHSNFYNRIWKPACKAAELDPAPGIHSLRHSHVAWLIADGTPLPVIQARLGHEKITTTIDTYGHLLPDTQAAAASAIERALAGSPLSGSAAPSPASLG